MDDSTSTVINIMNKKIILLNNGKMKLFIHKSSEKSNFSKWYLSEFESDINKVQLEEVISFCEEPKKYDGNDGLVIVKCEGKVDSLSYKCYINKINTVMDRHNRIILSL